VSKIFVFLVLVLNKKAILLCWNYAKA